MATGEGVMGVCDDNGSEGGGTVVICGVRRGDMKEMEVKLALKTY